MNKIFKYNIYAMLAVLSFNAMAVTVTDNNEEYSDNSVIYKIDENGIDIIGKMKSDFYKKDSDVILYVFKDSIKVYNKYTTQLRNNVFLFENLVSNQSNDYIKHYEGTYFYKIVVEAKNGENFNKTYKITNNKYSRVKIDQSKGITYPIPENSVDLTLSSKVGLQNKVPKKQNVLSDYKTSLPMLSKKENKKLVEMDKSVPNKMTSNSEAINTKPVINESKPIEVLTELSSYIDKLDGMFAKYEKEYLSEKDKIAVSEKFKEELTSVFKSGSVIPDNLCNDVTKSFAKSVYKLTKTLKLNDMEDASFVLKNIRRFRVCN